MEETNKTNWLYLWCIKKGIKYNTMHVYLNISSIYIWKCRLCFFRKLIYRSAYISFFLLHTFFFKFSMSSGLTLFQIHGFNREGPIWDLSHLRLWGSKEILIFAKDNILIYGPDQGILNDMKASSILSWGIINLNGDQKESIWIWYVSGQCF